MRLCLLILILLSFGGAAVLGAESDKIETQGDMNEIAKQEFDKTDKELNELYNIIVKYLDDENNKRLKSAEKAWIKYRDAHCDAATFDSKGGSIFYMVKYSCLKEITEQRISVLKTTYREQLHIHEESAK